MRVLAQVSSIVVLIIIGLLPVLFLAGAIRLDLLLLSMVKFLGFLYR